ncbi:MAG: RsmB/NOP family class I SAM-dependent RNA methyltransferase, partial [Candidatus Omnitrophica bacterium]|nr:RsmB/NOP family class I SAM-dependent RNA methyltransferase [Candidatus Omnitrophota bacterium]
MKVSLNSSQSLPTEFIQRLQHIVPQEFSESVLQSFSQESLITLRINELRSSIDEMKQLLREKQIHFQEIAWFKEALVMDNLEYQKILELGWIEKGMLYRQNLSSMLVGRVIAPKSGEDVLDLCAAPGSKATHMAALMNNSGELVVVESVRSRFYRLKSVAELLGVENMKFVYC